MMTDETREPDEHNAGISRRDIRKQLRDQLETKSRSHLEKTSGLERNVIIRISNRKKYSSKREPATTSACPDSFSSTKCCGPLLEQDSVETTSTPSTCSGSKGSMGDESCLGHSTNTKDKQPSGEPLEILRLKSNMLSADDSSMPVNTGGSCECSDGGWTDYSDYVDTNGRKKRVVSKTKRTVSKADGADASDEECEDDSDSSGSNASKKSVDSNTKSKRVNAAGKRKQANLDDQEEVVEQKIFTKEDAVTIESTTVKEMELNIVATEEIEKQDMSPSSNNVENHDSKLGIDESCSGQHDDVIISVVKSEKSNEHTVSSIGVISLKSNDKAGTANEEQAHETNEDDFDDVRQLFVVRSGLSNAPDSAKEQEKEGATSMQTTPFLPDEVFSTENYSGTSLVSSATFSQDGGRPDHMEVLPTIEDKVIAEKSCLDSSQTRTITKNPTEDGHGLNHSDSGSIASVQTKNSLASIEKALKEASLRQQSVSEQRSVMDAPEPALVLSADSMIDDDDDEEDDEFRVATLYKIPFVHGNFSCAAPIMLNDLTWMRILRQLMPEAHAQVVSQMRSTTRVDEDLRIARQMKWAENNPVVTAFGLVKDDYISSSDGAEEQENSLPTPMASNRNHMDGAFVESVPSSPVKSLPSHPILSNASQSKTRRLPALEWSVFVDPALVNVVDFAIQKCETVVTRQEKIYAKKELDRQLSRMVHRMILSKGTASQIASEAVGISSHYTFLSLLNKMESTQGHSYSDANHSMSMEGPTMTSRGGPEGMFINRWLATFAQAICLGTSDDKNLQRFPTSLLNHEEETFTLPPACGLGLLFGFGEETVKKTAPSEDFDVICKFICRLLGGPLTVILDPKSKNVPPRVWARLVDFMFERDVIVEAITSFQIDDVRSIAGLVASPVKEYLFFHSAGDLQRACHAGEIKEGDHVFFNAASLLASDQAPLEALVCGLDWCNEQFAIADYGYPREFFPPSRRLCRATIEDYKKKFNLNIGCYVQEFAISADTLASFVDFFNSNASIYNLGFAYGGINGRFSHSDSSGDGFSRQRYMGRQWNDDVKPLYSMESISFWDRPNIRKAACAGSWGPIGAVNGVEHIVNAQLGRQFCTMSLDCSKDNPWDSVKES